VLVTSDYVAYIAAYFIAGSKQTGAQQDCM